MATIVDGVLQGYHKFMAANADPRTQDWFFMSSPLPLVCLLVLYVYGCTSLGPRLMRDRKPFKLTNTLIIYNAVQVVGSACLFWEGLDAAWLRDYSYKCQPVDFSDNPKAMRVARCVYVYFMFKVIELLDTIFFVLRKKMHQVSFLHVYHHTLMPICAWIGVRFLPGGHGTLLGLINTLVHVIMYFYYMLAAMGPQYQRYLTWKPYVTVIQMIQFLVVLVHSLQVFVRDCNYPKSIAFLLSLNAVAFLYMFGSFYYRTYVLKGSRRRGSQPPPKKPLLRDDHSKSNGNGVVLINNNYVLEDKAKEQ